MTTRLRETNPLNVAAAWLSEQDDDLAGYQAEDIIEDARLGNIELWATIPEWQTTGEIDWLRRDKAFVDAANGAYSYTAVAARSFLASDGRIRVTSELAKRLIEHGECSFDCVRMPIIDCSNESKEASDSWLQGTCDGRLIKIEHIRVTRDELLSFVREDSKPVAPTLIEASLHPGATNSEISNAPWKYPAGFDEKKLKGLLREQPKWILSARLAKGVRGGGGRGSPTWNPAKLAMLLHDVKGFSINSLTKVINNHFESHLDEWNKYRLSWI